MSNGTPAPAGTPGTPPRNRGPRIALWIVLLLAVAFWIFVVGARVRAVQPVALWGIGAAVTFLLLALAGREINGQWFGILIDTRNKLSLARLQITLWTIMVLTAFLTIAIIRVRNTLDPGSKITHKEALDIKFPPELLLAMGISAASFAGATLIKSNKTTRQVAIEARATPEAAQKRQKEAQAALADAENKLSAKVKEQETRKQTLDAAIQAAPNAAGLTASAQAALNSAEAQLLTRVQAEDVRKQALEVATQAVTAAPDAPTRQAAMKEQAKAQALFDAATQDVATAVTARDAAKKALEDAKAPSKSADMLEAANVAVTTATKDRNAAKKVLDDADVELKTVTEAQGLLHKNADPSEARWVDLFRGEEIGNYKLVDMSKVQMLFFTVAVIAAYVAAIVVLLRSATLGTAAVVEFPDFNDTLNGLLGISHGTYLSVKAVNHS